MFENSPAPPSQCWKLNSVDGKLSVQQHWTGGKGGNFPTLVSKVEPWTYCVGKFPRTPFSMLEIEFSRWETICATTLNWGKGGKFSNTSVQGCSYKNINSTPLLRYKSVHFLCRFSIPLFHLKIETLYNGLNWEYTWTDSETKSKI